LSHELKRQNTSEEFDRLNILAHHILAPFFAIRREGKNIKGKNISVFSAKTRHKDLGNKALRISRQTLASGGAKIG
jgi:hypothetical protein